VSNKSFHQISLLLGDLPSGEVYAATDQISELNVQLYRANWVDTNGNAVGPTNTLNDLAGGLSDPRFFLFPKGEAGVLLEATGDFYFLTEF
jgi:hypothetical protein